MSFRDNTIDKNSNRVVFKDSSNNFNIPLFEQSKSFNGLSYTN